MLAIIRIGIGLSIAMGLLSALALVLEGKYAPTGQNRTPHLSRQMRALKLHYFAMAHRG